MTTVRTRFAPSPTGFIHLGNIRSALYPWAYARAKQGVFILRIEDTDEERSTQAAVDVILDGMRWLGLDPDEGPYYQMQRMDRYRAVLREMLDRGLAYWCYMTPAELDALRERQMAAKQKPRYDGTWRPEPGKTLPPVPEGVRPVLRFKSPQTGTVGWDDKVKGRIEFSNEELDDLVIARAAPEGSADGIGTPTYNFCVVVDDIDMAISHVIRGDDHVNNTPRQIHIFRALGQEPPVYAHLPTVLNEHGEKMSKRNGAKPVTQYRDEGFLPEAMVNYLARLGWSHGDAEIFSREQFLQWFDLDHLGKSAAQFDEAKLRWVNAQHLKAADDGRLALLVGEQLRGRGLPVPDDARLQAMCALFKDRCATTVELADWLVMYVQTPTAARSSDEQAKVEAARPALQDLTARLRTAEWTREAIQQCLKDSVAATGLKLPQLAIPVRLLVCGRSQTPSIDAVLSLFDRETVLARLQEA
ncbi:glutamate--tRNA ligase [Aquabacterium sp. J223]|uniref:glutamate--tRNA ligase n=1 Tax=Aquabacterium sp. J223 TaxID=2898431 RepID=UPI0021AE2F11|nr:glutamate--tRNA ligase [Aquabacterium sp. J223]UUX94624.1 glutamate--tRNA ligase [Aquabacterium sp. J223]